MTRRMNTIQLRTKQSLANHQQQQPQRINIFQWKWIIPRPSMTKRHFYSIDAGSTAQLTNLATSKPFDWLLTSETLESIMSQQERTANQSGRLPKLLLAARSHPFLCHCEEPSQRAWGSGSNSDDPLPLPPCSWDADSWDVSGQTRLRLNGDLNIAFVWMFFW